MEPAEALGALGFWATFFSPLLPVRDCALGEPEESIQAQQILARSQVSPEAGMGSVDKKGAQKRKNPSKIGRGGNQ